MKKKHSVELSFPKLSKSNRQFKVFKLTFKKVGHVFSSDELRQKGALKAPAGFNVGVLKGNDHHVTILGLISQVTLHGFGSH